MMLAVGFIYDLPVVSDRLFSFLPVWYVVRLLFGSIEMIKLAISRIASLNTHHRMEVLAQVPFSFSAYVSIHRECPPQNFSIFHYKMFPINLLVIQNGFCMHAQVHSCKGTE